MLTLPTRPRLSHLLSPVLSILRRMGGQDSREDDSDRRRSHLLHAPRTRRHRRPDHSLELPASYAGAFVIWCLPAWVRVPCVRRSCVPVRGFCVCPASVCACICVCPRARTTMTHKDGKVTQPMTRNGPLSGVEAGPGVGVRLHGGDEIGRANSALRSLRGAADRRSRISPWSRQYHSGIRTHGRSRHRQGE